MVGEERWRCLRKLVGPTILGGLMAFGLTACGTAEAPSRPTSTTSTTSIPSTTPSATTSMKASLRVVACPTTYGVTPPPTTAPLSTSMEVTVPRALAAELAVYTDGQGRVELLAPTGWTCSAGYGADGSGGVATYPPGESIPESALGGSWTLSPNSPTEAIVASQTGGCEGCEVGQACPLFATAASNFQSQFGRACPKSRPATETVDQITPGVVIFQDPPGVSGDGSPSGGQYAADGAMTYYSKNQFGSWLDTCTLPKTDKTLCTAALNIFISWYGDR